jgi:hypothetical protein
MSYIRKMPSLNFDGAINYLTEMFCGCMQSIQGNCRNMPKHMSLPLLFQSFIHYHLIIRRCEVWLKHTVIGRTIYLSIYLSVYGSIILSFDLSRFFSSLIFHTVGRTPWTGDQPLQSRCLHTDIHVLSGIRTYDSSAREIGDSSWLRPRDHCDRLIE